MCFRLLLGLVVTFDAGWVGIPFSFAKLQDARFIMNILLWYFDIKYLQYGPCSVVGGKKCLCRWVEDAYMGNLYDIPNESINNAAHRRQLEERNTPSHLLSAGLFFWVGQLLNSVLYPAGNASHHTAPPRDFSADC